MTADQTESVETLLTAFDLSDGTGLGAPSLRQLVRYLRQQLAEAERQRDEARNDVTILQGLYDGAVAAENAAFGEPERPMGDAASVVHWLRRERIELRAVEAMRDALMATYAIVEPAPDLRARLGRVVEALTRVFSLCGHVHECSVYNTPTPGECDCGVAEKERVIRAVLADPSLAALAEQVRREREVIAAARHFVAQEDHFHSDSDVIWTAYRLLDDAVRALPPEEPPR